MQANLYKNSLHYVCHLYRQLFSANQIDWFHFVGAHIWSWIKSYWYIIWGPIFYHVYPATILRLIFIAFSMNFLECILSVLSPLYSYYCPYADYNLLVADLLMFIIYWTIDVVSWISSSLFIRHLFSLQSGKLRTPNIIISYIYIYIYIYIFFFYSQWYIRNDNKIGHT